MALISHDSFNNLEDFFGDDDWFLPVSRRETPQMDVYETEDSIVTEVNVPDMDPDNLSVNLNDDVLRIRGEQTDELKEEEERGYFRREIRKGAFERTIRLPTIVDEDEVDATYEKGILKVTVPKKEEQEQVEGKEIEIQEK